MQRFTHSAVSLAVVLIAYLIYARVAVPLIEPSIAGPAGAIADVGGSDPANDQRIEQLQKLFPLGSIDLKKLKVLENDQVILLLNDYKNLDDGRVELLPPFAMVRLWDGEADDEAQRLRQSIILQTSGGAVLKFKDPINLSSFKISRLVGGALKGDISISSHGKSPGPEDDLMIRTSEVQLNEQEVSTPRHVDFTWGNNSGSGSDMHIKLVPGPPRAGRDPNVPNIAIESFELRHIDALHLELPQSAPTASPNAGPVAGVMSPADGGNVPMDVSCSGPFTFNVLKRVASFANRVTVSRVNPNGPADQIQGELLSIYFAPRGDAAPDSDYSTNLEPERIEARGHPVIINAPAKYLQGQGERLDYNIKTSVISLDGGPDVFLIQGPNEIHARSLQYRSLGPNKRGGAAAQGPGWLKGEIDGNRLEASWKDKLRMEPKDQYYIISFTGGTTLNYPGFGTLGAGEISFWLKQAPAGSPAGQANLAPEYMKAQNQVSVDSPRLSAALERQLEIWFVQNPPAQTASSPPGAQGVHNQPQNVYRAAQLQAGPDMNQQHFKIAGRSLRARMKLNNQQIEDVADIEIQDAVRLEQTPNPAANEPPTFIEGDYLHGTNLLAQNTEVNVTGRPAHCEVRGLALTGSNINLKRGTNRLSISGPGRMDFPLSGNSFAPPLAAGQPANLTGSLQIDWQKGMSFDGLTATFEQSVSARTPQFLLQTTTLEARLKRPVSFSDSNLQNQDQNEVEEIRCHGGVSLENHSFDARQQPTSFERMQVADLAINLQNGALTAGGPGWLNRVFINSAYHAQTNLPGAAIPGARPQTPINPPPNAEQSNSQLYCLHVCFQESIKGGFRGFLGGKASQGELIFEDQIRAAYAPVFDWSAMLDPDKQDKLGPKGILLHCNQLRFDQLPLPSGDGQSIEVEASGNARVEGGDGVFTARGQSIAYAEAKSLLILKGDGRTNAELYRQIQPGAPFSKTTAQRFQYNFKTGEINLNNAGPMEFNPAGK
jgi:lipopolysaccharide export system protein LptA